MPCERQCHRCVVPEHVRADVLFGEEHVDQLPLGIENRRLVDTVRQVQQHASDAVLTKLDLGTERPVAENWLFNKEDATLCRTARQQVLRPLKHEIPPEM